MTGAAPTSAAHRGLPRRAVMVTVVALLSLHFSLAVGSKLRESTTSDELVHLTAGVSYWKNHDYRLHPENGILPQRWAALPAWLAGAKFPALSDNEYWRMSDAWVMGHQFFYETGEDHFPRLMAARAMIALFSVALGFLVWWWSRRLFGDAGALISLTLYSFCPTFLAHGALATSDTCMAFFFVAATGAWWWHLHDGRPRVWWLSALTLGLAFVAKYSAVLLLPMMVAMAIVRARAAKPLALGGRTFDSPAGRFGAAALSACGHAVVVALVIWICYGFRYAAFNPGLPPADSFIRPWSHMVQGIGAARGVILFLAAWHVLPEAFLYGLAYVIETASMRSAFLNGDYSVTGWPTFFPWTFLLKTTLPLLIMCGLVTFTTLRRWAGTRTWRSGLYPVTPLLVLFVVYWLSSATSHLNIGHRHLLPIYPVLFIASGALGGWLMSRRFAPTAAIIALLGWHVAESVQVAPHYLAYFNEVGGGPDNGWRHLVDSSLDWGQDLPGLKAWLDAHAGNETVFLSYFGTGQPAYYGIHARRLPFFNNFKFPPVYVPLAPGIYCISATMLQQVYSPVLGPWTLAREQEYQRFRKLEPVFAAYTLDPAANATLNRETSAAEWQRAIERHDLLRFARLCHYLRVRPADANVGHSILIYRVNAMELAEATAGSLADWSRLIEQAAAAKP